MGKSTPSGTTTTTSTSAPWTAQQPYLLDAFQAAQQNYGRGGPHYYPGATIAAPSPTTTEAQDLTAQRALAGSPTLAAADRAVTATANGDYLAAGNPYLTGVVDQLGQTLRPQIESGFEGAGRYGSGAAANAYASALTNEAGNLAYQNYAQERQNQLRAASLAPTLAAQDYTDLGQLGQIGAAQDQRAQSQVNADVARYNYNQNLPYNNLSNYLRLVQGNYGSSQTQTTPYFSNPVGAGVSSANSLLNTGENAALLFSLLF